MTEEPSSLSAGEHRDQVDLVAILDGLEEFVGVCAGVVQVDFNDAEQFILFGEERLLHPWILFDQMVQTLPDRIPFNGHHLLAIGELSMRYMKVNLDSHALLPFTP